MIVCEKCFLDNEIISVIRNKNIKGKCPTCNSENVFIYDTNLYDDLNNMFDELVSIYSYDDISLKKYTDKSMYFLKDILEKDWGLFNLNKCKDTDKIILELCKDKFKQNPLLFSDKVRINKLSDDKYLLNHSLLPNNSWDEFVISLKYKNRFHTNCLNLSLLEKFCSYIQKEYKMGKKFYRSRISTKEGIAKENMGAPSFKVSKDGRVNAKGISCLYLSDSIETSMSEIRAGKYDYVTIGEFVLNENIKVVDLKSINHISPFIDGLDYTEHAINKKHLNKINDEMCKIMRKNDSELDYIPTQFISDYIKSIKHNDLYIYSGIEYKSVMNPSGYNLAIFNPSLFKCTNIKICHINNVDYQTEILN